MPRMIRMKYLRLLRGWSQKELAHRAAVSPTTVNLVETGRMTRPFMPSLARLAAALEQDTSDPEAMLDEIEVELVAKEE